MQVWFFRQFSVLILEFVQYYSDQKPNVCHEKSDFAWQKPTFERHSSHLCTKCECISIRLKLHASTNIAPPLAHSWENWWVAQGGKLDRFWNLILVFRFNGKLKWQKTEQRKGREKLLDVPENNVSHVHETQTNGSHDTNTTQFLN